jgi:hypothetical protein
MTQASHGLFAEHLQAARNLDGFGPREGAAPEPEPTALASLALDDAAGRGWLERRQRDDGGFALVAGPVVNDGATGLCALALGPGTARERALDHLVATRAQATASSADVPHDPNIHGWAWTVGTYGWVEPTSHAILALQALRPEVASAQIADGLALLADRECEGGGWNYGNPIVLGVTLEPYAQTTAMALVALQNAEPGLSQRGLAALRRVWPEERGGLSLALSLAAFELAGEPDAAEVENVLVAEFRQTGFLGDVVALAWAALATGPGLGLLRRAA